MLYQTVNPATEEIAATFDGHSDAAIEERLASADSAFRSWRRASFAQRAAVLNEAARLLEERDDQFAELMAVEMGKPLAEGVAEAKKCAGTCRHYAGRGEEFLRPAPHASDASESFVRYDPLGPILAIMPWNFPFWQVVRHAAPTLMAGNVVLLKHAPSTPRCALAVEQLFRDAGAPVGILTNLFASNEQAARIIADSRVAGVTLTGSTRAGKQVAAIAGAHLKKTVLELGGSDPFIVLPDADIGEAARVAVQSRCLNGGQSCISAKRFIVHKRIYKEFADLFLAGMTARVVGDPRDPATNIGPMARRDLRDGLADQVRRAVGEGARLLLGGEVPARRGFYYAPTVLVDVRPGMAAWEEEFFGPVALMLPCDSADHAVELANSTPYGLGASLWTSDRALAHDLAGRIESGGVFVNGLVKSDPRLPFGGIRESGHGRELGREGMLEFVNAKTVWIR